jgi:hypothetical protein
MPKSRPPQKAKAKEKPKKMMMMMMMKMRHQRRQPKERKLLQLHPKKPRAERAKEKANDTIYTELN